MRGGEILVGIEQLSSDPSRCGLRPMPKHSRIRVCKFVQAHTTYPIYSDETEDLSMKLDLDLKGRTRKCSIARVRSSSPPLRLFLMRFRN